MLLQALFETPGLVKEYLLIYILIYHLSTP